MEDNLQNLTMSGVGRASGGRYKTVDISGAATIDGNVECQNIHIAGGSKINGNVKAEIVKIGGGAVISGNLETSDAKIDGVTTIRGDMKADNVEIKGSTSITGNLYGKNIDVKGGISVRNDCNAEGFSGDGYFTIGGILKASNIDVKIEKGCSAKEMYADKITLKQGDKSFSIINTIGSLFNKTISVNVSTIEGDTIDIENVTAKIVKGRDITIGKECVIDEVQYSENLNTDPTAKVIKETKSV